MNMPDKVILHCSATPDYDPKHKHFNRFGAKEINKWHKERGFRMIGYHFVVRRDGTIEIARPVSEIGAHAKGYNRDSIGVCYIGTSYPTPAQIQSLITLFHGIKDAHRIGHKEWIGHHELNSKKTCPGFSMDIFRTLLAYEDESESEEFLDG